MEKYKKELILVVDDDENIVYAIQSLLEDEGYKTVTAPNGSEALNILNNLQPDLILLDVKMPKMGGYEFCKKIQSRPETKTIPVIFITGNSNREGMLKGLNLGGVDYIVKPFNENELMARIETQLRLKRAQEEINELRALLPICFNCKKIRTSDGYWEEVENYLSDQHKELKFTHALCDECFQKEYPDYYDKREQDKENSEN